MYKSRLQELCQKQSWAMPEYSVAKEGPDHVPNFTSAVVVNGVTFSSPAPCRSSKQAQNDAARVAFDYFTFDPLSSFPQPTMPSSPDPGPAAASTALNDVAATGGPLRAEVQSLHQTADLNVTALSIKDDGLSKGTQHLYKAQLHTYAQKRNINPPVYYCEHEGPPHASRFRSKVTVAGQVYESPEFFRTLKDAENAAAKVALMSLSPNDNQNDDSGLYKNLLHEFSQKNGLHLPKYLTERSGEAHMPIFVSSVEIGGEFFTGEGAKTKKQAEINAAKVAYNALKERQLSESHMLLYPTHQGPDTFKQSNASTYLQRDPGHAASLRMSSVVYPEEKPKEIVKAEQTSGDNEISAQVNSDNDGTRDKYVCSEDPHPSAVGNFLFPQLYNHPCSVSGNEVSKVVVLPRSSDIASLLGGNELLISDDKWVAIKLTPN